ncbi:MULTISPECIES: hypothetical protein [unclassified Pseudomonas]|uniref:hypothetical protein n=1 Tax=unclassified Pseudomonas TaxID=196821 RepID=UPI000A0B2818|nr:MULTISPECIES: hypothetical protein [unclassified Pseudomonas]SMF23416.1 hypothetical protein SAMN02745962_02423 [Pseudomonas sp. LAIL14HWK12:I11]SMR74295.1 hypothetical protein SAMN05661028_01987 [Pseudomonas sp. LAIL14HWK12:I10]SOD03534.1 hypothetical protein SAMN05660296_02428 [Pseudomonas sp. LAIL14HWK12:I8]
MNFFKRALAQGTAVAVIALSAGNAWADEFSDKVERIFSSSVVKSAKESGSTGAIEFKIPDRQPDYFETGDKANKVFAVESVRVLRDMPGMDRITMTIPRPHKAQTLDVSRAQVEQHYDISLSALKSDPGAWREQFIQQHDNAASRAEFVQEFVTDK